jgi:hypothetical protein
MSALEATIWAATVGGVVAIVIALIKTRGDRRLAADTAARADRQAVLDDVLMYTDQVIDAARRLRNSIRGSDEDIHAALVAAANVPRLSLAARTMLIEGEELTRLFNWFRENVGRCYRLVGNADRDRRHRTPLAPIEAEFDEALQNLTDAAMAIRREVDRIVRG